MKPTVNTVVAGGKSSLGEPSDQVQESPPDESRVGLTLVPMSRDLRPSGDARSGPCRLFNEVLGLIAYGRYLLLAIASCTANLRCHRHREAEAIRPILHCFDHQAARLFRWFSPALDPELVRHHRQQAHAFWQALCHFTIAAWAMAGAVSMRRRRDDQSSRRRAELDWPRRRLK